MPTILALDTSSDFCSVALNLDGQVDEIRKQAPRQHTQLLLPLVDELLARHQMSLGCLDAIAFGLGPGSFTGLRICFATVQGLAFGADLPVIGISTLHAMAQSAYEESNAEQKAVYVPMLDARMGQVYWGAYQAPTDRLALSHSPQTTVPVQADSLNDPADCLSHLASFGKENIIAVGPGWHYPALQAGDILPSQDPQLSLIEPWAKQVATLAQVVAPEDWQDVRQVQPVYLRDEISWEKRKRIRS